jgi:hypothetical protein
MKQRKKAAVKHSMPLDEMMPGEVFIKSWTHKDCGGRVYYAGLDSCVSNAG